MAIASIEKNLEFLDLQPERCNIREGNSYDLYIVLDMDVESCLNALQNEKTPVSYQDFSPKLVVCHSSPAAQKMRLALAGDPLSTSVAPDFISLPCGAKQIARAVTHTGKLYEEFNSVKPDSQGCDRLRVSEPTTKEVESRHVNSQDQKSGQPANDTPRALEQPKTNTTEPESQSPGTDTAKSSPSDLPATPTTLTHFPKSRSDTSHAASEKRPPTQPPTSNTAVPPTVTTAEGPVLLLVDDNRVNL